MNKQNQFCFLVKKKRSRKSASIKQERGVVRKPKEIFIIQNRKEIASIGEKENRGNSKMEGKENNFMFVESGENRIVLKRTDKNEKKAPRSVKSHELRSEKQKEKIFDKNNSREHNDFLLDFDNFLEEINTYSNSIQQITVADTTSQQQKLQIMKKEKEKENKFTKISKITNKILQLQKKGKIVNKKYKHIDQKKLQIKNHDKKPYKRKAKIKEKEDIYNINNFIIHPNQIKITKKLDVNVKIQTPQFKQLDATKSINEDDKFSVSSFSSVEDTSDHAYLKLHSHFEKREREYLISLMDDPKKKKVRHEKNKTLNRSNEISNAKEININKRHLFDCSKTETSEGNFKFRIDLDKD